MIPDDKKNNIAPQKDEFAMEDFSIAELENRLEFLVKCNINCNCPTQP